MFTGIIENKAKVLKNEQNNGSLFLSIEKPEKWKIISGESIASDGVCLTVKKIFSKSYEIELMKETLRNTTFGKDIPLFVNLERSLVVGDRISGHFVSGHVDTVGRIKSIKNDGAAKIFTVSFSSKFKKLIVKKGSIAVDGISLTVVSVNKNTFSVSVLPYTFLNTNLGEKKIDSFVNLEFDLLAKYVQNTKSNVS